MKDYPAAKYGDTPSSVRTTKEKEPVYKSVQSTAISEKHHPDSTLKLVAHTKSTAPSTTAYEYSDVPDIDVGSLTKSSTTEGSKEIARKDRSFQGKSAIHMNFKIHVNLHYHRNNRNSR